MHDINYISGCLCVLPADKLPFCLRILLEQCVRKHHDIEVTLAALSGIVHNRSDAHTTVSFSPARVLFQDFT